jgi:hypothetical protein
MIISLVLEVSGPRGTGNVDDAIRGGLVLRCVQVPQGAYLSSSRSTYCGSRDSSVRESPKLKSVSQSIYNEVKVDDDKGIERVCTED